MNFVTTLKIPSDLWLRERRGERVMCATRPWAGKCMRCSPIVVTSFINERCYQVIETPVGGAHIGDTSSGDGLSSVRSMQAVAWTLRGSF